MNPTYKIHVIRTSNKKYKLITLVSLPIESMEIYGRYIYKLRDKAFSAKTII